MSALDQIMDVLALGPATADEIGLATGTSRTVLLLHLKALMLEGKVYKHKQSKKVFYSTEPALPESNRVVRAKPKIKLPDIPPIMLNWMGYTDREPDQLAGRFIEGEY